MIQRSRTFRRWSTIVLAVALTACGGGDTDTAEETGSDNQPSAVASPTLPPVTSRYVRSEGTYRVLSDAAQRSSWRISFERLFDICNFRRQMYEEPSQSLSEVPGRVLESIGHVVQEEVYDSRTGAARRVFQVTTAPRLVDLQRVDGADEQRAPNCLEYQEQRSVETTIWSRDGYVYSFVGESPELATKGSRRRMTEARDLQWGRLPTDEYAPRPRRQVGDWYCRQAPRLDQLAGAAFDQCHLDPDGDVLFRVLPIALETVVTHGLSPGGQTNDLTEELRLTPTSVSLTQSNSGQWLSVDQLPQMPQGVPIQEVQ